MTFEWYKNNKKVEMHSSGDWWAEGEFSLSGDHDEIFAMEPGFDHLGYYHCLVSNAFGTAKSEVIQVVNKRPERETWETPALLTNKPGNHGHLTTAGSLQTFKCEAGEDTDITWTKNATVLPDNNGKNELVIANVAKEDIATYACNASNPYG